MKKFWGRGSSTSSSVKHGSLNRSGSSSAPTPRLPSITKKKSTAPDSSPPSIMPSRKQRMQLLKCIIHHADAVQNKYLLPKDLSDPNAPKPQQSIMSIDNMSSMFSISTDKATAEINEKCYQRWHEVLQEGLVPMSVHALNLLQKSTTVGVGDDDNDDEEEAYFATMEGMDEEIQVMAILARAAALNDVAADSSEDGPNNAQDMKNKDGMEQINAMMKCIAMLLFHIVLQASSSSSSESNEGNVADNSNEAFKTAAGYDGRVRHVTKLACVDVLTRAIVESVESYEKVSGSIDEANINEDQPTDGPIDIDDYSLWNMTNIKSFLDQDNLGKDAIFGTVFYKQTSGTDGGGKLLLENRQEKKKKQDKRQSQTESDEQSVTSGDTSKKSQPSEAEEHDSGEMPNTIESIDTMNSESSSFEIESESFEVESEEIKFPEVDVVSANIGDDNSHDSNRSKEETQSLKQEMEDLEQELDENSNEDSSSEQSGHGVMCEDDKGEDEKEDDIVDEVQTKRQSNAKYLATRKFELIERLVAIDIVRFLMAEEREVKIRQQELEQQKMNANKLPSYLRRMDKDTDDAGDDATKDDDTDSLGEDNTDSTSDADKVTNSQFFTASRVKQMKRSAKIAGMGLALGTVFAIVSDLSILYAFACTIFLTLP